MRKALVLCAGFGTRMGEFTKDCPKPMLDISGIPILKYTILNLKYSGIVDIAINLHFMPEIIKDYFGSGEELGVKIKYLYEEAPSGTAGPIVKLKDYFKDCSSFLVMYGDIFTNQNLLDFINFHEGKRSASSIVVHKRMKSNSIVEVGSDSRVENFIERPDELTLSKYTDGILVNSGIYCFSKNIFDFMPDKEFLDFPKDIFNGLIEQRELYAYTLSSDRFAIDTPSRLREAKSFYERGKMKFLWESKK